MRLRYLLVPVLGFLGTVTADADPQQFDSREVSAYIEEQIRTGVVPGAAVAVVTSDAVLYAAGFGTTLEGGDELITPGHTFRTASTLKMMVGVALVRLHEQGRLDLHAPISRYLTGLVPEIGQITTHQLLNHTSGVVDIIADHATPPTTTLTDYARSLDESFIYVSPGASFSYSNLGYSLAGAVLEAATGQPFEEAMRDLVFAPLHMDSSTFSISEAQEAGLAIGHWTRDGQREIVTPQERGLAGRPSGALLSTVLDYGNFLSAFLNDGQFRGRPVWGDVTSGLMNTPQIPPAELVTSYSYSHGLMIGQFYGQPALFHTGGMPGYAANVLILPELDIAIVLFTNGDSLDRTQVLYRIASQFASLEELGPEAFPDGLEPLNASEADDLMGVYIQREDLPSIHIFARDDAVILRNREIDYVLRHEAGEFYVGLSDEGYWARFRIAVTPDGQYRFVQWWIRSFARAL